METPLRCFHRVMPASIALLLCLNTLEVANANEKALILQGSSIAFEQIVAGLVSDLEQDLELLNYQVTSDTSADEVSKWVGSAAPSIIVLVGNHAIKAYTAYQKKHKGSRFPPALAMAALYVDQLVNRMENTMGIRYEIPAVTSIVNLRALLKEDVSKVGVIYRSWMQKMIRENSAYCQKEGIELVGYEIQGKSDNYGKQIRKGIKNLLAQDVDAFWVVNDNALLSENGLREGWMPGLEKTRKPVIVGVKSLIKTQFNFGSFAIVPDHYALGVQGADTIADLMDSDWLLAERKVEHPLSVNKLINLSLFNKKGIAYRSDRLAELDEVIR